MHRHAKHANTNGGLGACPPGNFEKLHLLRLNIFSNLLTIDVPVDTGTENFLKCIICMPIHAAWVTLQKLLYIKNSYASTSQAIIAITNASIILS